VGVKQAVQLVQAHLPAAGSFGLRARKGQASQCRVFRCGNHFAQADRVAMVQETRRPGPEAVQ